MKYIIGVDGGGTSTEMVAYTFAEAAETGDMQACDLLDEAGDHLRKKRYY